MKKEDQHQGEGDREKKIWVRKEVGKPRGYGEQYKAETSKRIEVVELEEDSLEKNDDLVEETGEKTEEENLIEKN